MDKEIFDLYIAAGKAAGREKTCGSKIGYSEESAGKAAESMNKKPTTRNNLEAYPCAFCDKWHVGRAMSLDELKAHALTKTEQEEDNELRDAYNKGT
jgi:hypothetical protein